MSQCKLSTWCARALLQVAVGRVGQLQPSCPGEVDLGCPQPGCGHALGTGLRMLPSGEARGPVGRWGPWAVARPSSPPPRAGEGLCPRSLPLPAAGISPRAAAQVLCACHPHTFRSRTGCLWLPSGHLHGQAQCRPLASATAPAGSHAHLPSSQSGPRRPRATDRAARPFRAPPAHPPHTSLSLQPRLPGLSTLTPHPAWTHPPPDPHP